MVWDGCVIVGIAGVWDRSALTRSTSFDVAFDEDLNKAIHKSRHVPSLRAYIAIVRFVPNIS
jgi:hypothetical protein